MKKQLLLSVLMLLPMVAMADAVEIDGIYYDLIAKGHLAKVTSHPEGNYKGEIIIPESFNYMGESYTVVSIATSAFMHANITSVEIPNSVTTIEHAAFYYCQRLRKITIGNGIQTISNQVFDYCYNIESVFISDLASWCKIEFNTYGGSNPLNNSDLYLNGEKVTELVIPSNVTSISENAFAGCSSLTSVTIPGSVTSMGRFVFRGCENLVSATFENGVSAIGSRIFDGCSKLKTVIFANTVTSIGEGAFFSCSSLERIDFPNNISSIGEWSFGYCKSLKELTIPCSVNSIGKSAFYECDGLKTITIAECDNLWSIGEGAFEKCKELADFYCYTNQVPWANEYTFRESYIEYANLHVKSNLVNDFKNTVPWKYFGNIVALTGETPETPKCATPTINFVNGELVFNCETEGVEFVSEVTVCDAKKNYSNKVNLTGIYQVSVYATKSGYYDSDVATENIDVRGIQGDTNRDGVVTVADAVGVVNIILEKNE